MNAAFSDHPAASAATGTWALDRPAAVAFLRAQQAWLGRHLAPFCRAAVAVGVHIGAADVLHEQWLHLVAAVGRANGGRAARRVADVYGFHGRVAGTLHRDLTLPLEASVTARVRGLLAARLGALTDDAVRAIRLHAVAARR